MLVWRNGVAWQIRNESERFFVGHDGSRRGSQPENNLAPRTRVPPLNIISRTLKFAPALQRLWAMCEVSISASVGTGER